MYSIFRQVKLKKKKKEIKKRKRYKKKEKKKASFEYVISMEVLPPLIMTENIADIRKCCSV